VELIWLAVLGGMVVLAVAGAAYSKASTPGLLRSQLEAVAAGLGLPAPAEDCARVEGVRGGLQVSVEGHLGEDDAPAYAEVHVTLRRTLRITLKEEGLLPSLDFKTGDAPFDKKLRLGGESAVLAGAMSAPVRAALVEIVARSRAFRLEARGLRCQSPRLDAAPEEVARLVDFMVYVAAHLEALPPSPEAQLLANVRQDPVGEVRLNCALLLDQEFGHTDERIALPDVLMVDPDPHLQLMGASLGRPGSPRAIEVALEILAGDEAEWRKEAAWLLRDHGSGEHVPALLAALPEEDPAAAEAVAEALGRLGDPGVEAPLVRLLLHPGHSARAAAAEGLARLGTVAAVEALLEVAGPAKKAARAAVAAIQSRLEGAEAGRLAVVDGDDAAGRLSEARWDEGALAIADEE
jgi:hypothetical protein